MLKFSLNLRTGVLCALFAILAVSQTAGPIQTQAQTAAECELPGNLRVTSEGPTPTAGYATLKQAFDAVNAGTHTGTIVIKACADTTEAAPATLNASGSGPANYSSLLLTPAGNAPRTISGSLNGSPLLDLNGADNVTINGINHNGNSLTIANTSTSANTQTSTIRFINGATNNVIENATILGSSTFPLTTYNGATIFFAGTTASGAGNSDNTVTNCDISSSPTGPHSRAILSQGSASSPNQNNTIEQNGISDYSLAGGSAALLLNAGTAEWTISNNRFFQTATRSIAGQHEAIRVSSGTGGGYNISGNVIGFSSSAGTGVYSINSASNAGKFVGINIVSAGATLSRIDDNTISSIQHSGLATGVATSPAFAGILISSAASSVEIGTTGGNTVGSATSPGSIEFTTSAPSEVEIYGIYAGSINSSKIQGNLIAGLTATGSGAQLGFSGIKMVSASASAEVKENTVGTAKAGVSIDAPTGYIRGIDIERSGTVQENEVRNIETRTTSTNGDPATIAIRIANGASSPDVISENIVTDVSNTSTGSSAVQIRGVFYSGLTTGNALVERNHVSNVSHASTNNAAAAHGIGFNNGNGTLRNNMVAVGSNISRGTIYGIGITTGTAHAYHNSVYVSGTASVGTSHTFALHSNAGTSRVYRNNVLVNARTNSGSTGKHYALRTSISNANLLDSNYNVLLSSGLIGLQGTTDRSTLADWQTATGQDSNSFSEDPEFVAPDAAVPDLHIQPNSGSIIEGNGFDVGVLHDFDGEARSELTPVDIGADAGNFAVSTGNPGTLNFAQAEYVVDEDIGTVGLTVERSGGSAGAVSAAFQIHDATATGGGTCSAGVDMINTGGLVEFADGETSKLIQIEICNDDLYEGDENFSVTIANPTGGATIGKLYSATVTIADDDEQPVISFDSNTYQQAEGREVVLTVARVGSLAALTSAVWAAEGVTAVGGECGTGSADFAPVSGSVNFAAGEDAAEIRIMLCGDGLREDPAETFTVTLESAEGAVIGAGGDALVTILDAATEFEAAGPGTIVAGGVAEDYPSELEVAGKGAMAGVRVTLFGVTHGDAGRLDVLLVSPAGRAFVLMAAAGSGSPIVDAVITFEDAAAGHLPAAGPIAAGVNHRPTACAPVADLPPPAPSGPYLVPGCNTTTGTTLTEAFAGTEPNGTWRLYVRDRSEAPAKARTQSTGGSIAGWGLQMLAPTSANVSVSGRVLAANGRGIPGARLTLTSAHGSAAVAVTNAFGYYTLDTVPAGLTYTITASARGHTFAEPVLVIALDDNIANLDFQAEP